MRILATLLLTMCVVYRADLEGAPMARVALVAKGRMIREPSGEWVCWVKTQPRDLAPNTEIYVCTHPRRCTRARTGPEARPTFAR